jgi:hypothetical protein
VRTRPDLEWRDVVRRHFIYFSPTTSDPEADFLAYMERTYSEEKERVERLAPDAPERSWPNLGLLAMAVALLTYGRLDVIGDLLGNVPPEKHPARVLARSVDALIPLGPGIDARADPAAALAWIEQHRSRLSWSAHEGRFQLAG